MMVNIPTASTGGEHGGGVCHLQSRYEDGEIVAFGHGSSKFESVSGSLRWKDWSRAWMLTV